MLTGEGSLGDYVITCYDVISTIKAHDRCELGSLASCQSASSQIAVGSRPVTIGVSWQSRLSDRSWSTPCDRQVSFSVLSPCDHLTNSA